MLPLGSQGGRAMSNSPPATVFIVDDDLLVQRALERLLRAWNYRSWSFSSTIEFLATYDSELPGCIILDLAMPDLGGLEVQERLAAAGCRQPIIFLTGNGDISASVRAMRAGAVNFLTKPIEERQLLDAIEEALYIEATQRHAISLRSDVEKRLAMLTRRERQVLEHVVAGRLNKQIAGDLGTVEKTIKVHRSRAMQKLGARSLVELVRLAAYVGIREPLSPFGALPSSLSMSSRVRQAAEAMESVG
jgi:FixJ family two-component response regulator